MAKQTTARSAAPGPLPLRLAYTGAGIPPAEAPLRDLDEGDLHRVHRIRALLASGGEYVDSATADDLEAVALSLCASGAFTREIGEPGPEWDVPNAPGMVLSAEQVAHLAEATDQPADPAGKE